MNHPNAKTAAALVGAVALAASAAAGIAPAFGTDAAPSPEPASQQHTDDRVADLLVKAANVQGSFEFDQGVLSSNEDISERFSKAAAALCANLPAYLETLEEQPLNVSGGSADGFSATLSEMADEEGTESYELACSCASNTPGGGAIANAEVEGVSLASIANKAQAR